MKESIYNSIIFDYPVSDKNWINCFYCREAILVENFSFTFTTMVKGRGPRARKEKREMTMMITIKPVSLINVQEI